jgi:hypothetical protein
VKACYDSASICHVMIPWGEPRPPMSKLIAAFALLIAVVAGGLTVATVIDVQRPVAYPCSGGNC